MTHAHIPRKRFGQNFLINQKVIHKIIDALNIQNGDNLVEIGAGTGALTAKIIERASVLQVIEIDRDLTQHLRENFPESSLKIYEGDALKCDFNQFTQDKHTLRIIGNLPYNISTPLLFHLLTYADLIQDMLFMLQKEVIERICAKPNHKNYGRLSVMIQYACQTQDLFDIPPSAFSPPPKVMSSMVHLIPYAKNCPHPKADNYPLFAQIVNQAFCYRRKTLRNALKTLITEDAFEATRIDPMRRPETLSVSDFVRLSNHQNKPCLSSC